MENTTHENNNYQSGNQGHEGRQTDYRDRNSRRFSDDDRRSSRYSQRSRYRDYDRDDDYGSDYDESYEGYAGFGYAGERERGSRFGGSDRYESDRYGSDRYGSDRYGSDRYGSDSLGTTRRNRGYGFDRDRDEQERRLSRRRSSAYGSPSRSRYESISGSDYGYDSDDDDYSSGFGGDSDRLGRSRENRRNRGRGSSGRGGYYLSESWSIAGPFTGKGPKNFKRSDEDMTRRVGERLERNGDVDASDIEVSCKNGSVITLKGEVPDRETKRIAEDCAYSVYGVKDVDNDIKVNESLWEKWFGSSDSDRRENRYDVSPSKK